MAIRGEGGSQLEIIHVKIIFDKETCSLLFTAYVLCHFLYVNAKVQPIVLVF